jgi:hypothetical protein
MAMLLDCPFLELVASGDCKMIDPPLMIRPILPLPRPRCCVCGTHHPRHAFITVGFTTYWYCGMHWAKRPEEHRNDPNGEL